MNAFLPVLLTFVLVPLPAFAQSTKQIETILGPLESNAAPGAAVLVVQNGKTIFQRGYGVASLKTHQKIDTETNFRLASVSKQFTAAAIMLLVHDGKLSYDDCLTNVFPEFPAYGRAITIRNLLNHTSGLPDYEDLMPAKYRETEKEEVLQIHDAEVLKLLESQSAAKFAAGSKWEYSNSGYVVLAMIVEKVSGQSFREFLQKRIFAPLGMTHTIAYEKGKNQVFHRAYGYARKASGWREHDQSATSATLGDGGIYSSITDLQKWDEALRLHTLLTDEEMRPALTPVVPAHGQPYNPEGRPAAYGFGWFLNPYRNHKRMWHYGETVGFSTAIERFPDDQLTVVVLCNREDLNAEALALKVADALLGNER